jgi:hypothetical protein
MRYKVKWTDKVSGGIMFGIVDTYSDEAKKAKDEGLAVVSDAVLPKSYFVPEDDLIDIENVWPSYNRETGQFEGGDAYEQHVQTMAKLAADLSDGLPDDKLRVGHSFRVGVADGFATYVVTKVNKKTCEIEWRGFCADRYTDQILGWGGTFQIDVILPQVQRERKMAKLFGGK